MDPFSEIINKECVFFINNETYHQNENSRYWKLNKLNFFFCMSKLQFCFFIFVFKRNIFG